VTEACVVFGVGNDARGDDALGPALMAWLEAQRLPGVRLVADFQLNVEHALDLEGAALALFIDAGIGTPTPFSFHEVQPQPVRGVSSMRCHRRRLGGAPACTKKCRRLELCVRGEAFERARRYPRGAGPPARRASLPRATAGATDVARWRALVVCRVD